MSGSMTLEERLEALMKNCEYLQAQNEEMTNQNAYGNLVSPCGEEEGRFGVHLLPTHPNLPGKKEMKMNPIWWILKWRRIP